MILIFLNTEAMASEKANTFPPKTPPPAGRKVRRKMVEDGKAEKVAKAKKRKTTSTNKCMKKLFPFFIVLFLISAFCFLPRLFLFKKMTILSLEILFPPPPPPWRRPKSETNKKKDKERRKKFRSHRIYLKSLF